jgi:hypothetical protein
MMRGERLRRERPGWVQSLRGAPATTRGEVTHDFIFPGGEANGGELAATTP